jgi:hypothetical protein
MMTASPRFSPPARLTFLRLARLSTVRSRLRRSASFIGRHPCERGEFDGRQPGGLLPDAHGDRHGDGELPIGDMVAERVRAMGVAPFYKHFAHDGARSNIAAVYSDRGYGIPGRSLYNRSNEAAAALKPGDFDWSAIFDAGVVVP